MVLMRKIFSMIYYKLYVKIFKDYHAELEKAVGDCNTLLDVGCGSSSPIGFFSKKKKIYCVGIDSFQPAIEQSKEKNIHNEYIRMDLLDMGKRFKPNSFDCVLASDLIEHFTKEEGIKLIDIFERIAKKRVIIFTPNGFLAKEEHDNNPWQLHKSGWTVKEMREGGYKVIGINGWKPLRGNHSCVKFRPMYLWLIISDITQLLTRYIPEKAFHILCVKDNVDS